jgi:Peptidase inhibitor family I36
MRKNMKKTSRAVAAAGIAALVTTLGVAGTEQSASAGGSLWVFSDANTLGSYKSFNDSVRDLSGIDYEVGSGPINDSISSIINDTDTPWCFYADADYTTFLFYVDAHARANYVGDWANDRISSFMGVGDAVYCPGRG